MFLKAKKLVLVLATFTLVIETKKKTVKTTEAIGTAETVEIAKAVESAEVGKNGAESKNEYPNLVQVLCIQYPINFWKKSVSVSALFDLGSKVNTIHPTLTRKLKLPVRPTDVGAQKIDGIMLDTFEMVVIAFSVTNKANQVRFFEETFLVANVSPKVVFGMLFLI